MNNILGNSNSRKRKFIYSGVILVIVFYFAGLTNILSHNIGIGMDSKFDYPLYDLGFKLSNDLAADFRFANDYTTMGLTVFCGFWILLFNKKNRYHIFTHWFVMLFLLFAFRCLTVSSTVLPKPWRKNQEWASCDNQRRYTTNKFLAVFEILLEAKFTCFDFIYSGHTVNITLVGLIIKKWSKSLLLKWFIWIVIIINFYFMIGIRGHYTVDIELGLVLTVLLWMIKKYQIELEIGFFNWWFNLEEDIEEELVL